MFIYHVLSARRGCADPSITPFDCYHCKDGMLVIAIGNDDLWERFCRKAGLTALLEDPRFQNNWDRTIHYDPDLKNAVAAWCAQHTRAEIESLLEEAGIPCSPVMNMQEAVENPQIKARNMMVPTQHPLLGEVEVPGPVVKFSATPGAVESPSPLLGQHSEEILRALGYTEEELAAMHAAGVYSTWEDLKAKHNG